MMALPRMRPLSTERSPTYGCVDALAEQVELDDGTPPAMMSLRGRPCVAPGTDVAMPWTPVLTRPWDSASCSSATAALGRRRPGASTSRSVAANFAPSMICWMNGLPSAWVTKPSLMPAPAGPRLARGLCATAAPAGAQRECHRAGGRQSTVVVSDIDSSSACPAWRCHPAETRLCSIGARRSGSSSYRSLRSVVSSAGVDDVARPAGALSSDELVDGDRGR